MRQRNHPLSPPIDRICSSPWVVHCLIYSPQQRFARHVANVQHHPELIPLGALGTQQLLGEHGYGDHGDAEVSRLLATHAAPVRDHQPSIRVRCGREKNKLF